MTSLPLTPVADVVYFLPAIGGTRTGFNLPLIITDEDVITPSDRVQLYSSLAEMVDAGFSTTGPAYLAATVYFAANGRPSQVAIGRQASGETAVQAVQACRAANSEWYMLYFPGLDDSEHLLVAAYIEALSSTPSIYCINSSDSDIPAGTSGNLFEQLYDLSYIRTLGQYSTTDHAVCSIIGYAMTHTTDFANSAFTLRFKPEPGVTTEDLTTQQVSNIESVKGNVYLNRGTQYDGYEPGYQFSGDWSDEIIGLDKLVNDIQINVANLLYQTPKIPQTDQGLAQIVGVISASCERAVNRGFVAPGVWNGLPVLTLQTGDYLPAGYLVLHDSIDGQSQADRDARISPNFYVMIKLAGAIQSVYIQINVNR